MTKKTMTKVVRKTAAAAALVSIAAFIGRDALGEGVVQVQTSKSIPAATVAVIDPENGTSSGTAGQDVLLAAGDIILFRFNFTPVPDATNRGMNGYLTEYIPANTEVVGMRIVDEDGLTIEPRRAGFAIDGCSTSPNCGGNLSLPGTAGSTPRGSVYDVHADTGIFYTTDALLARTPADTFITMDNGISMNPAEPRWIAPGLVALLNDTTGPYRVHNIWDWIQIQGMGSQTDEAGTSATGASPYRYGSPVAGTGALYPFGAVDTDAGAGYTIRFNNTNGPWRRVRYPGSRIGVGTAGAGSALYRRDDADASTSGDDVRPANPVAATAMRVALGETRTGERAFAEVALRVLDLPIDPSFGGSGGNVDCSEVHGTDVAYRGGNNGDDHPWGFYVGSPACVFLRLLFDLNVSKTLAGTGDQLTYTISGSNLSVNNETGVVARLKFDSSRQAYVAGSAVPPFTANVTCPDDTTKQCLIWNLGTLTPGEDYNLSARFGVGGGGQTTNIMVGQYISDSIPAPGFNTQAVTVVRPIAVPKMSFSEPIQVAPNTDAVLNGVLANAGTADFTIGSVSNAMWFRIPTGWTRTGTWTMTRDNGSAAALSCSGGTGGSTIVQCDPPADVDDIYANSSRNITIQVRPPTGAATALYTLDASIIGSQASFGGDFETFYPKVATVPVGARRSDPPVIDCPVGSTSTAITGTTTENVGTSIRVYFNLIQRGTASATAGSPDNVWSSTNWTAFGELYGGLEIRATAQATGELESHLSEPCGVSAIRACQDGLDNDGDGQIDFPADPGCDSPQDNNETDGAEPECSNGVDDADPDTDVDWPDDQQCYAYYDPTEGGAAACNDGVDNDNDGQTDSADPDCAATGGQSEHDFPACMDGRDNDSDGRIDFPADAGCHSEFDDSEANVGQTAGDKARLMLVLDSSGSMNLDTCDHPAAVEGYTGGDGSLECPGDDVTCATCGAVGCSNGEADDSRLFKIKAGLTDVVAAFGEIDWGLMRFFQRDVDFQCPSQNASLRSGGWQGGGAPPCGGGFNAGELLVRFAPDNPDTILGWIDNTSNYSGPIPPRDLDYEVRGSGTTPIAGSLDTALEVMTSARDADADSSCRPYRVVLLTDGLETCALNPATVDFCDPSTPELPPEAAAAALSSEGMPVYVIGFATPDPQIICSLDRIAAAGGTDQAIFVDNEVELSAAMASIVEETIRFELCNGLDDDCDGNIDEDFGDLGDACNDGEGNGICFDEGVRVCTADGSGTMCNADNDPACNQTNCPEQCNGLDDDCDLIVDEGLPACNCTAQPETCNGADDDCDNVVDEDVVSDPPPECGLDVGECDPGTLDCVNGNFVCSGGTGPTRDGCSATDNQCICDTLDNDCDVQIDEGALPCYGFPTGCNVTTGVCQGTCQIGSMSCPNPANCVGDVGPGTELCNGADDDCDGNIDETFPTLGDDCSIGVGACASNGTIVCTADQTDVRCNAVVVTPGIETCNCVDDDCDGDTDEELGPPIGEECGGGQSCDLGNFVCNPDTCRVECQGGNEGATEICNSIDDDCDLSIDEGTSTNEPCVDPIYQTACDPDCDGTNICIDGQCIAGDTGECLFGALQCIEPGSAEDPPVETCVGYQGPLDTELCNGLDDDCDGDTDDMAECPDPDDRCVDAVCVFPCLEDEFPCPYGYYCDTLPEGGDFCLPNPCVQEDIECPDGQFCQPNPDTGDFECVDLCAGIDCPTGALCEGGVCTDCFDNPCPEGQNCIPNSENVGVCEDDLCFDASCGEGEFCDPDSGECVTVVCDPSCAADQICLDGACVDDPCDGIECSASQVCDPGSGSCVDNECVGVQCPVGFVCAPSSGDCVDDPCEGVGSVDCPAGSDCAVDFDGTGTCVDREGEYVFAGGGGCGCQTSDGSSWGSLLMMLGVLGLARRRRRRR
jgi:MYXO-CTERM domain-containing protein